MSSSPLSATPISGPKSMGASTKSEEAPSGPEDGQRHLPPESTSLEGIVEDADEEVSDTVSITIQKSFSKPRVQWWGGVENGERVSEEGGVANGH